MSAGPLSLIHLKIKICRPIKFKIDFYHPLPTPTPPWLRPFPSQTFSSIIMADRPVAAYLSPSRPLIEADLTACFGGGSPVLLAGDLNAKHVDWNSRLNTRRGKLLRDYADENSCLIFGPDAPTTNPYRSKATPDVPDIAMLKDFPFPVYLTSCSAISSDHLPVLIDTTCRSSIQHPPNRPDFRRTDWANFQVHLE